MKLKTYLHVIVTGLLFVAALSLYGGWYAKVGKESATAASLEQEIRARTQTVARANEAKDQLSNARANQAAITSYFVNTNDIVPFLETLQTTGTHYGATVAVESVTAQPAKPHTLLQLALRIRGSFDSVQRTLGAIEYGPYDTAITSVTLDTPADADGSHQWTAAVTMNVGTIDVAHASTTTP